LARWAETGLLARVHATLVGMLRGHPDLILDTCSVRAKRGGDLTGPNPTDRAKRGTKYHVAVDGDGVPVACAATAANVNDTLVFERLFLTACAVMARIRTVFADKGYDAEPHRALCRRFGAEPRIHKRGQPRGSGLGGACQGSACKAGGKQAEGSAAGQWSAATPGFWRTSASPCAMTGSASSSSHCCKAHAYSWLQVGSLGNSENRLLAEEGPRRSAYDPPSGPGSTPGGSGRSGALRALAALEGALMPGRL
jgi:transposase